MLGYLTHHAQALLGALGACPKPFATALTVLVIGLALACHWRWPCSFPTP